MENDELIKHVTEHGKWITMSDGNTYCISGEEGVETGREALEAVIAIFLEEGLDRLNEDLGEKDPEGSRVEVFRSGTSKFDLGLDSEEWDEEVANLHAGKEFEAGKEFAKKKALMLLQEVMEAYDNISFSEEDYSGEALQLQKTIVGGQIRAIKFAMSWLQSGGQTDFDGNRACLPW